MTSQRPRPKQSERLEEAGLTPKNTWEGGCRKPPLGAGSLPGEEGRSMDVVTSKRRRMLPCPLGNTELPISLSLPSAQREVNISSCGLQGKAEAPPSPALGNDQQFMRTGWHNLLCVQENVYLLLQNLTTADTTALKRSSWRGHSTTILCCFPPEFLSHFNFQQN